MAVAGLSGSVGAFATAVIDAARDVLADTPARDVQIAGVPLRLRSARALESLAFHPPAQGPPVAELLVAAGSVPPAPPGDPATTSPVTGCAVSARTTGSRPLTTSSTGS